MNKTRRSFTAQQKAEIVRRHLGGKEQVSDLADELGLQPSQIHTWVKQLLDHAAAAFQRVDKATERAETAKDRKILALETKLVQKNEVIGQILQEHVQLKKALGGL